MANKTLIIVNLTSGARYIDDLGVYIPASGQRDVTSLFEGARFTPAQSLDLLDFINSDILKLNDGIQDIPKAEAEDYLIQFSLSEHDLETAHSGSLPEARIQNDDILVRANEATTITAPWSFASGAGGKLLIETGATLPVGTIETGRVYWLSSDRTLHIGANGVWNDITITQNTYYNAPVMFEFGSYSQIGSSGSYINSQWSVSTSAPAIMARAGTIKTLSADAQQYSGTVTGYTMTLRKKSGSSWIDIADITKTDGDGYIIKNNVNVDFNEFEQIACFIQPAGSNPVIYNGHLYMEVIWREV